MQLKKLLQEDDAVSPVIGVILMVAITVILAAVIASFVLGMGNDMGNSAPQASFNAEFEDDTGSSPVVDRVSFTHESGQSIAPERLSISSTADVGAGPNNGSSSGDHESEIPLTYSTYGISDDWSAGKTVAVSTDNDLNSETIRIIYTSPDGGSSSTLHTWEGPDA